MSDWLKKRHELTRSRQLLVIEHDKETHHETGVALKQIVDYFNDITVFSDSNKEWFKELNADADKHNHETSVKARIESTDKVLKSLGREHEVVVLDCMEGLNPNTIYAASGLVKGMGLFVLICPPASIWKTYYAHKSGFPTSYKYSVEVSYFARYFKKVLLNNASTAWYGRQGIQLPIPAIPQPQKNEVRSIKRFTQEDALQLVCETWKKEAQLFVVTGSRGRGKSTLLAQIAHYILSDTTMYHQHRIYLCAPSKAQSDVVNQYLCDISGNKNTIAHLAPDQASKISKNDIVLVDEAGSIAPMCLDNIVSHSQFVIMTSTTDGYEGSAMGLMQRWLPKHSRVAKHLNLTKALRWDDNDALESVMQNLFAPRMPTTEMANKPEDTAENKDDLKLLVQSAHLQEINKEALVNSKSLFDSCFSLLMHAHYQSTPTDMLRMLDAPDNRIWLMKHPALTLPLGIICTIDEGGESVFTDPTIRKAISEGRRRVQGHLSAQALSQLTQEPEILRYPFLRIHRIAVHQDYRRCGIGSHMLTQLQKLNVSKQLITSFGLSPALDNFWYSQGYDLVKLGQRVDTSSGTLSALYVHQQSTSLTCKQLNVQKLQNMAAVTLAYLRKYGPRTFSLIPESLRARLAHLNDSSNEINLKIKRFLDGEVSFKMAKAFIYADLIKCKNEEVLKSFDALHQKHLSAEEKANLSELIKTQMRSMRN
uniref:GNAT family N-acetyltransferase n=1 Tax=Ningiella ruwaisensis TaxID=2364274 RepID=UPI0014456B8F|nr:GNAT family N-acetyltransferase [Ningiella ruwaisensis]